MAEPDEILRRLPQQSLLGSLPVAAARAILAAAPSRRWPKGAVLMDMGDDGDSLMVVLEGLTKVSVISPDGRELTLDYVGPGGILGELSVLDGVPRSARVTAVEPTVALTVLRRDVIPYLERNSGACLAVIRALCARLRRTNALVETAATLGLEPKLARGLLRLLSPHEQEIRLSQGDIANAVALSRENVNRQLREWQNMGLVELARGRLKVLDRAALEDITALGGG